MNTEQGLIGGIISLKYLSLVTLSVQNTLVVLIMRYSRTQPGPRYYSTTAVLLTELLKFLICVILLIRDHLKENGNQFSFRQLAQDLNQDTLKVLVPAILYTIQNNLQYVSVTLLDAATFQVTYQLKILTTALFSVILLQTQLSRRKWISLILLTFGIMLVQMPQIRLSYPVLKSDSAESFSVFPSTFMKNATTQLTGLLVVTVACILSGMAGVYFEKTLKGSTVSIYIRNTQMACFSLLPAVAGIWFTDGAEISENGFFYGYNEWVWAAILCQALGGLLVSVVIKFADNILKGFATSISIILSCLLSVILFEFHITLQFLLGAALVLFSSYLYNLPSNIVDIPVPQPQEDNYLKIVIPPEDSAENGSPCDPSPEKL